MQIGQQSRVQAAIIELPNFYSKNNLNPPNAMQQQLPQQSQLSIIKHPNPSPYPYPSPQPQQSPQCPTGNNGNQLISRSIEKGRESRFAFEKFLYIDYCLFMFCVCNIGLSLLYYDSDYCGKGHIADWCLIITDIMCVMQIVVTVIRYMSLVELQKSQKILQQQQTINSSGKTHQILLQILLLLIQPYSFLNTLKIQTINIYDNFPFQYKLNYIFVVLGFSKMFIIIRVLLLRQLYMSPRSSRLCRMYGCESNYLYAIKCLFKDSPLCLIGLVFAISIMIFALSLRIAQRNLVIQYPKVMGKEYPGNLEKFENALWLTIITMTTVGYGDFFPRTIFGRMIDVILVVWGTFIVSLMVVVLTNTLNMDQSQKRALIVLNRLQTKKSLKQAAAFVITHSCRKYLINKKVSKRLRPPLSDDQRIKLESSFYKYLSNFQNIHRTIRSMYEIDDVYEEMTRQFQFINDQVSVLLASQDETITNIHVYVAQEKAKRTQGMAVSKANQMGRSSATNKQNIRWQPQKTASQQQIF